MMGGDAGGSSVADRQFVVSLAGFVAAVAAFLAALVLFVGWGGWKAAAALAALGAGLLFRFYRGARPDLPETAIPSFREKGNNERLNR